MTTPKFDGAVLAGGSSSRMGRDKSALLVGGELLIMRQLRTLKSAGANPVWVSVRSDSSWPNGLDAGAALLRDEVLNAGPMAGVERILGSMLHDWVAVIAVDLPKLSVSFLRRLVAQIGPGYGVIPERDQMLEPLAAIYPRIAQQSIRARLDRRELELNQWASSGISAGWLRVWRVDDHYAHQLTNWNRPGDFIES